mgnify:CR=1 FL=1
MISFLIPLSILIAVNLIILIITLTSNKASSQQNTIAKNPVKKMTEKIYPLQLANSEYEKAV